MSYVRVTGCHPCRRSYHAEYTGSRPNSEVKLRRASLVLGWGTTRESGVTATSFFLSFAGAALCCWWPYSCSCSWADSWPTRTAVIVGHGDVDAGGVNTVSV